MSGKDLKISLLLDYYGGYLTEKQFEVMDLYYNEDLSLAEIAEHTGITRQGVRDSIKRGEATMLELEEKSGLVGKIREYEKTLKKITEEVAKIGQYNVSNIKSRELNELVNNILRITDKGE